MGQRTRHGRRQLDRAGIAAHTGAAPATVDYWYRQRAHTGFPDKADTDVDGRDWWWLDDVDAFRVAHLAAREATFTRVDRRGQPNDLIAAPQAAKVLGYKDHRSLPGVLLDNPTASRSCLVGGCAAAGTGAPFGVMPTAARCGTPLAVPTAFPAALASPIRTLMTHVWTRPSNCWMGKMLRRPWVLEQSLRAASALASAQGNVSWRPLDGPRVTTGERLAGGPSQRRSCLGRW